MDTELLDQILEAARLAASPADAMRIKDLQKALQFVEDSRFDALATHATHYQNGLSDPIEEGEEYEIIDQKAFKAWIEKLWEMSW